MDSDGASTSWASARHSLVNESPDERLRATRTSGMAHVRRCADSLLDENLARRHECSQGCARGDPMDEQSRADMTTDDHRRSVLLIGKSQFVLDDAVAGLRGLGHTAEGTNDFSDVTGRFDVGSIDLIVFGGQVPPWTARPSSKKRSEPSTRG